ncbi:MAG: cupredoxin domain-containing protein, partial [Actinobacteria bacterium]|nr:cupredoxin domain-containing protein [Actinomycetota bacterium]
PDVSVSVGVGVGGDEVKVEMRDFAFDPKDVTVASGGTIELDNVGQTPHTFTIEDEGIDEEVAAGEDATVDIELDPGTYDFVCTFHAGQEMTGTLTVE